MLRDSRESQTSFQINCSYNAHNIDVLVCNVFFAHVRDDKRNRSHPYVLDSDVWSVFCEYFMCKSKLHSVLVQVSYFLEFQDIILLLLIFGGLSVHVVF